MRALLRVSGREDALAAELCAMSYRSGHAHYQVIARDEGLTGQDDGMLREFFNMDAETKARFIAPGAHGQTGYTGLLVETAASSDKPETEQEGYRLTEHIKRYYSTART